MSFVSQIDCYIEVTGAPSHEDDQDLPGFYLVSLELSCAIDPCDASEEDKSQMAEAALNEFHEKQGIEVLDDFKIRVRLPSGQAIYETGHSSETLVKASSFDGKVDEIQLPFPVTAKNKKARP